MVDRINCAIGKVRAAHVILQSGIDAPNRLGIVREAAGGLLDATVQLIYLSNDCDEVTRQCTLTACTRLNDAASKLSTALDSLSAKGLTTATPQVLAALQRTTPKLMAIADSLNVEAARWIGELCEYPDFDDMYTGVSSRG
jgi:hypothetical protein